MTSVSIRLRNLARDAVEAIARIVIGEPARIVGKSKLDRLERIAYREILDAAERAGDLEFLRHEIAKNQLTEGDLRRLSKHRTPVSEWPEVNTDDLFSPEAFTPSVDSANEIAGEMRNTPRFRISGSSG